ncbi:MAG: ATP-binding protein [Candidatus Sericytochromatia bacterium]
MSPPLPKNELSRLENLQAYQILDTVQEQNWNDLAELAAYICQTPISAISFVDQKRQWFKSMIGLGTRETSRDMAFCAYAILQSEPLIVPNALEDPRFENNELVLFEPEIRFYAGAPIISEEGFELGSICVIDRQPRELTPEQIEALKTLSRQVSTLLKTHKQNLDLQAAKAKAEKLTQAKSDFIALLSHELRTPLNAIMGYSELLLEEELQPQMQKDVEKIFNAGEHLLRLINNLLDLSKIEAGKMQFYLEHVPLKSLVNDICETLTPLLKKNNNQLNLHCLPEQAGQLWYTDIQKLTQILYNLLSNANKFTSNGTISIDLHLDVQELQIAIRDTGIGMNAEHLGNLFQSFSQGDALTTRNYGGTGLGLALSQECAAILGGRIEVKSEKGQGSVFTLHLPCLPPNPTQAKRINA